MKNARKMTDFFSISLFNQRLDYVQKLIANMSVGTGEASKIVVFEILKN